MLSFMGFGTTLYGKRSFNKLDNSYIATKWFILLFLPIFPITSYRILRGETKLSVSLTSLGANTGYKYLREVTLNKKQVILTYVLGLGLPALVLWLLFNYWISWIALFLFVIGVLIYHFYKTLK